jgi:hypothetical protein
MTQTKVTDLTVDELKGLIREVATQTISEILRDPDEGLELREEAADQLGRSLAAMKAGTRGATLQEVAAKLGLEA